MPDSNRAKAIKNAKLKYEKAKARKVDEATLHRLQMDIERAEGDNVKSSKPVNERRIRW